MAVVFYHSELSSFFNVTDPLAGLPSCPALKHLDVDYPSTTLVYGLTTIVAFVMALVIMWRYNSVKVFHEKIRKESISNTAWLWFFILVGIRGVFNTLNFALEEDEHNASSDLFIASLFTHAFVGLLLTLALDHQRLYRSPGGTVLEIQPDPSHRHDSLHGNSGASLEASIERDSFSGGSASRKVPSVTRPIEPRNIQSSEQLPHLSFHMPVRARTGVQTHLAFPTH